MHSIVPGIVAVGLCASALLAYKDGPPPNMTGGFGGETCHMCHTGNPLNAPGGSLRVSGMPEQFRAGSVYRLTVTLVRPELYTGGFQMAARSADGRQAGGWRSLDDRTKITAGLIQQTLRGSRVQRDGENQWEMEWTAPEAGDVQFHIAANASNDDDSPLGDFIYTSEFTVRSSAR